MCEFAGDELRAAWHRDAVVWLRRAMSAVEWAKNLDC